jgi:hypothetical protein
MAIWLRVAARLKSTAAFSKWMFTCPTFLLGLKASYQVKVTFTCSLSLLNGKRVSMAHSAL